MKTPRPAVCVALVSAALACLPAGAAADWLVSPKACRQARLSAYWQTRLPLLPGETVDGVYARDRQVYVTTDMGVLIAVAADTGLVRWSVSLAEHGSKIFAPFNVGADPQDGYVLVTTVAKLFLLDQLDGNVLLGLPLRLPPSGPAVTDGSRIFVGGNNGWLHSINLQDGFLSWRTEGNLDERLLRWPGNRAGNLASIRRPAPLGVWGGDWSIRLAGTIPSPPALAGELLYFADSAGRVYCVAAENKKLHWSRQLPGEVLGTVVAAPGGIYVGCANHSVYCLDPDDGRLVWRFRTAGPCEAAPVLTGDTLYQFSTGAGLYAIDPATGTLRWHVPHGRRFLAQNGTLAYVLIGGELVVMDNVAGEVRHRLPAAGAEVAATNLAGSAVFLGSAAGSLICIRPADVPYLRVGQVRREMRRPSAEVQALDAEIAKMTETTGPPPSERHPLESDSKVPPIAGGSPTTP